MAIWTPPAGLHLHLLNYMWLEIAYRRVGSLRDSLQSLYTMRTSGRWIMQQLQIVLAGSSMPNYGISKC